MPPLDFTEIIQKTDGSRPASYERVSFFAQCP